MNMSSERTYRNFSYKDAGFRICCDSFEVVTGEIVRQREALEEYIAGNPDFVKSFCPVALGGGAPESARRMSSAAWLVGVGPMAAVAGVMAQMAAEAGLAAGDSEIILENGGDIYLKTVKEVTIGLYAGPGSAGNGLSFRVLPEDTPLSICSSSGRMGRSTSLGKCDLATVVAEDAAIADAAATRAANLVNEVDDIEDALIRISGIAEVQGVLISHQGRMGMAGRLPELVEASWITNY